MIQNIVKPSTAAQGRVDPFLFRPSHAASLFADFSVIESGF
jgi:hypothetical protein